MVPGASLNQYRIIGAGGMGADPGAAEPRSRTKGAADSKLVRGIPRGKMFTDNY